MTRKIRQTPSEAAVPVVRREVLHCGRLRVDTAARTARIDEQPLDLQPKVFDLLTVFLREPGVVHTREELFQRLWPGTVVLDGNLTSALSQLRRALDDESRARLRTVPRVGYAFDGEVVAQSDEAEPRAIETAIPRAAAATAPSGGRPRTPRRAWWAVAIGIAVLLPVAIGAWLARPGVPQRPIVVLGPITAADPGNAAGWLALAIRDAFVRRIGSDPAVRLVDASASAGAALLAQAESGASDGADFVLRIGYGSPSAEASTLSINVTVHAARGGRPRAAFDATAAPTEVVARADALALAVRGALLPDRPPPELADAPVSPAAIESYTEGLRALDRQRLDEARTAFERAVVLAPGFAQAELRLAEVLRKIGYDALAAGLYRRLATEAPDGSESRLLASARGHALAGDHEAAGEAFARLLARYPDDPRHAIEWARVLVRSGVAGRAPARRLLDTAAARSAVLAEWEVRRLLVLGLLQEHEGVHREAAATFEAALALARTAGLATLAGDAALERGRMHQRLGDRERARESWRAARLAYADAGLELDEAAAELNLLLSARFDDPPADPALVRAGVEAFAARARELGAIEREAQTLTMLAEDLDASERHAEAVETAMRASARFAELGQAFEAARAGTVAARALLALGDADAAWARLAAAAPNFRAGTPEAHEVSRVRVQVLLERGEIAAARQEADAAVALLADGTNPELLALARCVQVNALRAAGADREAREALDVCIAWRRGAASPNLNLVAAEMALERGDGARVRAHLERAVAAVDALTEASASRNRLQRATAALLLRAGDLQGARAWLARVDPTQMAQESAAGRRDHALLEALLAAYLDGDSTAAARWLDRAREPGMPGRAPDQLLVDLVDAALADPRHESERRDALLVDVRARAEALGHAPMQRLADALSTAVSARPEATPGAEWLRHPLAGSELRPAALRVAPGR